MADYGMADCPFCEGNHLQMYASPTRWQVCCMKCRALGPVKGTEREAIQAWNKCDKQEKSNGVE